jgi:hypothetical protein
MSEAQFLTAITPAKDENAAQSLINKMTGIAGENLKGIRVDRGVESDLVVFRVGPGTQTIRQGEWSADAATFAITQSANTLKIFAVENARSLRRGNQVVFSSALPTSIAVNYKADEVEVSCNAATATKVSLFVGKRPVRVLLDGKDLSANGFSFNRKDGTISLDIPRGQHDLKIMLR